MQDIVLWMYKTCLRVQYLLEDIMSWKDPKFTVKAFLLTLLVLVESYLLGDALFFWLLCNFFLMWPIVHQKKGKQIDSFISTLNEKIDGAVNSVGFFRRRSLAASADKKNQ